MHSALQQSVGSSGYYLVAIPATNFLGIFIALPFWVSAGEQSHFQFPGVCLFVLTGFLCCTLFLRCPRRPLWQKFCAAILMLPALFFAVDSVMLYAAFGVR
jgi:hypothetical protein